MKSIYIYSLYVQYNVIILLGHNITDNDVNTQQNEACVKMNIVFQLLEHVVYSNNYFKIFFSQTLFNRDNSLRFIDPCP